MGKSKIPSYTVYAQRGESLENEERLELCPKFDLPRFDFLMYAILHCSSNSNPRQDSFKKRYTRHSYPIYQSSTRISDSNTKQKVSEATNLSKFSDLSYFAQIL